MNIPLLTLKKLAEKDGISTVSGWKRVKSGFYIKFCIERKKEGQKGTRNVIGYIKKTDLINLLLSNSKWQ